MAEHFSNTITDIMTLRSLLYALRKSLTNSNAPLPIEQVVSYGFLSIFSELLKSISDEDVIMEIGWCLTNIAASKSEYVFQMRQIGIHYQLIELFKTATIIQKAQYLWCLGNIICDGIFARDEILGTSLLADIKNLLKPGTIPLSFIRIIAWVLSAITRGKPAPQFEKVFL